MVSMSGIVYVGFVQSFPIVTDCGELVNIPDLFPGTVVLNSGSTAQRYLAFAIVLLPLSCGNCESL